jgi:hypothetical protein
MLKRVFAALGALVALGTIAFAGNVPLITGPQDPSQLNATINALINSGNSSWNPTAAPKANGSVAVTVGSLGPTGVTPTTISKWFKIIDSGGNIFVVPAWSCPTC